MSQAVHVTFSYMSKMGNWVNTWRNHKGIISNELYDIVWEQGSTIICCQIPHF